MDVFIKFNDLLNYGIGENYLKNALKRYRQGKTSSWNNKKDEFDKRKVLINLDSIPEGTRLKYNIPTGKEYKEQKIKEFESQKEQELIEKQLALDTQKNLTSNAEKLALYNAYQNEWITYYSLYKERYKNAKKHRIDELAKLSAKEHAFWLAMVNITGNKFKANWNKSEIGFSYYLELKKELVFSRSIKNLHYFRRKMRDIRSLLSTGQNIVELLAIKKADPRPETMRFNEFHKGLILYYVGHEKKYSYRLCTDLINHHCIDENQPTISESYIKTIMVSDNEFRTLVYSHRNGTKFLNENILPHSLRFPVEFPANLWMIDGTPIQFFCIDKNKKVIRLSLFVILDAFSRKVVGFDIALNEDKFMVMNALKMAVKDEGHLPKEILSDNFSANKTDEIKDLKEQMERMGVNWRNAKVGNPQDKVHVERFFGVFQSEECALYDDYIGEGITSRRDNRPNPEFLSKNMKKLLTVDEMFNRIVIMIAKYNEREKRTRKSPLELYKLPKPKAVEMDGFKTALMFWNKTKHTIKQGMVKITVRKVNYVFEIKSHKLKSQLQGKSVYVYYDTSNLDSVMLFDIETKNAICECFSSLKFHIATDDRTEECNENLLKHTAKVKSYKKYLEKTTQSYLEKVLDVTGKESFQPIHPAQLQKNQINEQESKDIIETHLQYFNIHSEVKEPNHNKLPQIVRNGEIVDSYESMVVNKKSSIRSSLKVVKNNDN